MERVPARLPAWTAFALATLRLEPRPVMLRSVGFSGVCASCALAPGVFQTQLLRRERAPDRRRGTTSAGNRFLDGDQPSGWTGRKAMGLGVPASPSDPIGADQASVCADFFVSSE